MPGFFRRKKRKGPQGPNKNEKKVLRSQETERLAKSAEVISELFPSIQRLSLQLDFITPQKLQLERQTLVFSPNDACDFLVPCPGRCGGEGFFDLVDKIKSVIEARGKTVEETGVCQESIYPGSPETCGFQLRCKIEAAYSS